MAVVNWAMAIAVALIGMSILYRQALPQPIAGIPYNRESATRLMGDMPLMLAMKKNGGIVRSFFPWLFTTQKAPVVQFFRGPFFAPVVAVGDYTAAYNLLVKHGKDFTRGYTMKAMWRGIAPGHFVGMEASDPAQKAARELTKDLMTPSFLHEVNAPASYSKILHFVEFWQRKMARSDGRPFDAGLDLHALIYDIIMAAATNINQSNSHIGQAAAKNAHEPVTTLVTEEKDTSISSDIEVDDLLQSLNVLSEMAGRSLTQLFPRLFYFLENRKSEVRKAFRDRDSIISGYISDSVRRMHEAGGSEQFSPLSAVDFIVKREAMAAQRDGRAPSFFTDTIIHIVFGYLLAGHDTTHSAISFMVKHLGSSQDEQQTLRQELRKAFPAALEGNRQPSMQEIIDAHIPYLDATIEEVLRMHPPAFGTSRLAMKDIQVLGHTIPKGSPVFIAMTGATYTEHGYRAEGAATGSVQQGTVSDWGQSAFPAGDFHPERWLTESETGVVSFNPKAGPMLSFSAGGRACWGKKLAYMELKLVVSVLVWNFQFDRLPAELEDWKLAETLTIKPKTCRVILSDAGDKQ
ncbi:cytochrome P450 [Microdochium trichocladiopsis]|uniref:Cytochrome P450 n=1 Tax=Microdochium trichocladiopsis TaxID=1682393 RepID=A0A9P9BIN9_9PEZI|nr:cytochrome P450 [Microdochium trichocladiopsis]KAH7024443.1 cytochrome P450 [Microdochium trichocladiopsis]